MTKDEVMDKLFTVKPELKPEITAVSKAYNFHPVLLHELKEEDVFKEWIWEEFIAKGHATMLSAMYKAGKSTFLRAFIAAMQSNEEFVGMPIKRCNVLIVSEEHQADWVEKRQDFGIDDRTNIHLLVRPVEKKLTLNEWENFISDIDAYSKANDIELVIIDTLPSVWPTKKENDASDVTAALLPFNKLLNSNIALLFLWHFKKDTSGEEGTSSRGSTANMAWVDCIIELKRLKGEAGNSHKRQITTLGRFELQDAVIEFTKDYKFIVHGTRLEVSKKARLEVVKNIFIEHSNEPLCQANVREYLSSKNIELSVSTINRFLKELLNEEFIVLVEMRLHKKSSVPYYKQKSSSILRLESDLRSVPVSDATQITFKPLEETSEVIHIKGEHDIDDLLDKTTPLYKEVFENDK